MYIQGIPIDELKAELARREAKAREGKRPIRIPYVSQDWSAVRDMCVDYLIARASKESVGDLKHYIFEAAMEAVYGKDVWPYLNSLPSGRA